MQLTNVAYKQIVFTRVDGIDVNVKAHLLDPNNLDENFLVLQVDGIATPKEISLFYWMDAKRWTLNEFHYFALNNRMCVRILDRYGIEITSFGYCSNASRVHDLQFGINFD